MDIISGKLLVNGFWELKIRPLASEVIRHGLSCGFGVTIPRSLISFDQLITFAHSFQLSGSFASILLAQILSVIRSYY